MRRVRIMAAECADLLHNGNPDPATLMEQYFQEILLGLEESRRLHPAKEQVDFVFREANDRWVNFCAKLTKKVSLLDINTKAFEQWSNGQPYQPLVVSYRSPTW